MSPHPPPLPPSRLTPRQSVEQECGRRGTARLVAGCVELLAGGDADYSLVYALGGPAADSVLGPHPRRDQRYFLRVWAARALLYAWDEGAPGLRDAVLAALADESWRVREMAAKVVARREFGDGLTAVAGLQHDPVPRVRAAAARATAMLTAARA
jgi:HEAT repeat protein